MDSLEWQLPRSVDFAIRDTYESGRSVFATTEIRRGKLLLTTSTEVSPVAHVILRPYRKEVCAQCFSYDRGREWKIRDVATGTVFCRESCQQAWGSSNDTLMYEALSSVETFIRTLSKRQSSSESSEIEIANATRKSNTDALEHIRTTWRSAENEGTNIIHARRTTKPTKPQRAALRRAKELSPDPDILAYVLLGVLAAYKSQQSIRGLGTTEAQRLLPSLFSLAADSTVFLHTPTTLSPLADYTSSYLVLLAILPGPILDITTSNLVINLASRASHNAFSIRPEGVSDGDQSGEFLGWGVWPEASFFNHSCRPNVRKERKGRFWTFCIDPDSQAGLIDEGEQLCITYLGGDERDLDVNERRRRLSSQWGFQCCCDRCKEESGERKL